MTSRGGAFWLNPRLLLDIRRLLNLHSSRLARLPAKVDALIGLILQGEPVLLWLSTYWTRIVMKRLAHFIGMLTSLASV